MIRLLAFIAFVTLGQFFVQPFVREALASTVTSPSLLVPFLAVAAPDMLFYGAAGLALPLFLAGSDMRLKVATAICLALVLLAQAISLYVLGSVSAAGWRGYVVAFAPLVGALVAFAGGVLISSTVVSLIRSQGHRAAGSH